MDLSDPLVFYYFLWTSLPTQGSFETFSHVASVPEKNCATSSWLDFYWPTHFPSYCPSLHSWPQHLVHSLVMTSRDASAIASSWVSGFGQAAEAGDVKRLVSTFLPDGYLRDILVFTWNNRTLHGHDNISSFLGSTLAHASITNVQLDERQYFCPTHGQIGPGVFAVSTGFTFETPIAKGNGYARLVEDEQKQWKALSVFTMIDELKGYPEIGQEWGSYGGHTRA